MTSSGNSTVPMSFRAKDYEANDVDILAQQRGVKRSYILHEAMQYYLKTQPLIAQSTKDRIATELLENRAQNLIKNLEKWSKMTEIERKMHIICDFLLENTQKKTKKPAFFTMLKDIKGLLLDIANEDMAQFGNCKDLLKKRLNKDIYRLIFENEYQIELPK